MRPPDARHAGLLLVLALARLAPAGQTGAFTRFSGGGPARTDCMLVTDVAGARGRHAAWCTDGDPTCDGDATINGTCAFAVRLCVDATGGAPRCHADVVTAAQSDIPALEAALGALGMPVASPDTCTEAVPIPVALHGRQGRLVIRAGVEMASGHADRDRVALVCQRPPSPATFATLQEKIFTPGCAISSCHGAAQSGGLGLAPGEAYGNLVGVAPTNPAALSAGLLRVAPGDPARSFLLAKLQGTLTAGEGDPMPRVGGSVSPRLLDLVRRWIVAGAPADTEF